MRLMNLIKLRVFDNGENEVVAFEKNLDLSYLVSVDFWTEKKFRPAILKLFILGKQDVLITNMADNTFSSQPKARNHLAAC